MPEKTPKTFDPLILILFLLVVITGCGAGHEKDQPGPALAGDRPSDTALFHRPVTGANAANIYLYHPAFADSDQVFTRLLHEARLEVLRFPGGTNAGFYHPHEAGYGYRASDLELLEKGQVRRHTQAVINGEQQVIREHKVSENYIHRFTRLARHSGVRVMYVANLLNGSAADCIFGIRTLTEGGVEVVGIELGNEFHLPAYAKAFPAVNDYIEKAKAFADSIRSVYPSIPLSVVAAPAAATKKPGGREKGWNDELARHSFYDALSIHYYARLEGMKSLKGRGRCTPQEALSMAGAQWEQGMAEYKKTFGQRPLWVTEWNVVAGPQWCSNGPAHAFFVQAMLEKAAAEPRVQYLIYHTLLSKNQGYNLLSAPRDKTKEDITPLFAHYAFVFFDKLSRHLETKEGVWRGNATAADSLEVTPYYSGDAALVAVVLKNTSAGSRDITAGSLPTLPPVTNMAYYRLGPGGLSEQTMDKETAGAAWPSLQIEGRSMAVLLF